MGIVLSVDFVVGEYIKVGGRQPVLQRSVVFPWVPRCDCHVLEYFRLRKIKFGFRYYLEGETELSIFSLYRDTCKAYFAV